MTSTGETVFEPETVAVEGRRVRYAATGSGPPLVCLHGYPETGLLYGPLARRLGGEFTVIAVDWPGLGGSDPWPGRSTPGARAAQIPAILDALGHEDAYLFGTDMGAPPAMLAGAQYPDRIRGVIASNALLFGDGETSWEISLFRALPIANRLALRHVPRVVFRRAIVTFLPPGVRLGQPLRKDFWTHFGRRPVRDRLAAMCADYEDTLGSLATEYANVPVPVLALWGTADKHFLPSQGQRLAERVPEAEFVPVVGGHHWMVAHRPSRIAGILRRWIPP